MSLARRKTKSRRPAKSAGSVFQQSWFVQMIPSPVNGEVRLRMTRPAAWVGVSEAAELIACSAQKVHDLCEEGALRWRWLDYEGAGGKKLVLVDSVQLYMARKSPSRTSQPQFALR
jgi:hypothetical protein